MKSNIQDMAFAGGALLVIASALLYMSDRYEMAPFVLAAGVAIIVLLRILTPYRGTDFKQKRLYRNYFLSSLAFIASVYFMFKQQNAWIATLLIASIVELYVAFRMPGEKSGEK